MSAITREVRVGAMSAGSRCKLCGCFAPVDPSSASGPGTMVQLTVRFPLTTVPSRFAAICEPCAVVIWRTLDGPA